MKAIPHAIQVWDSGLRSGRENHAIDRLWLQQHASGRRPDLLRFYCSRPSASIGRYQAVDRELRLDYCRSRGIEVARRLSGGGALYLDPQQLGFTLVVNRSWMWSDLSLQQLLGLFSWGVAEGLRRLGIAARYKYPNDLEIDGRKIASVFAATEGGSLLLHGILLLDADIKTMLEALRVPTEKLSRDGLAAARERLATMRACLGETPALEQVRAALEQGIAAALELGFRQAAEPPLVSSPSPEALEYETAAAGRIDWSDDRGSSLEALLKTPGGTLRVRARFDRDGKRFSRVEFAGDFHINPPGVLSVLERTLEGLPVGLGSRCVEQFFREQWAEMPGLSSTDIASVLNLVIDKRGMKGEMGLDAREANSLMVFSPGGAVSAKDILAHASVMLVPYCAKPGWCKWRHLDGCAECGLCAVGEAYRMARSRGMRVTTITNYEHLVTTLNAMKADGVAAYVGMCCSNFFVKRHRAFQEAGIPTVLMDISGANCYELKQEGEAYAGRFEAQAKLNAEVLEKVMKFVPQVNCER